MSSPEARRSSKRFGKLEERLGYHFQRHEDLERALTHASARRQSQTDFHYERLEFLGDRVLGVCIADLLHHSFTDAPEGELSLRYNALVREETLAEIADEFAIHEFIRTGGDLKKITGKRLRSIRADVVEALIAAIYLDGGLDAAMQFIKAHWTERVHEPYAAQQDPKTALQEWAHAESLPTPRYKEISRSGPDHDPAFTVEVRLGNMHKMRGSGRSKRTAEKAAARQLLEEKGIWENGHEAVPA